MQTVTPSNIAKLEALLFVAGRPLGYKHIVKVLGVKRQEVDALVLELKKKYNNDSSGIALMEQGEDIQLVTHPALGQFIEQFVKKEITGELTRPQLETLAIVAYRGPITKPFIEEIRGVNCSLIIRNLLIRGLIEEVDTTEEEPTYVVTIQFLRHLGLNQPSDLPQYQSLSQTDSSHESKIQQ